MFRSCRLALAGLLLAGCAEPGHTPEPAGPPGWPAQLSELVEKAEERFGVPSVSAVEADARSAGALLIDVRTAEEFAVSHIPGARPLVDETARAAFLAAPPAGPVLVVCTAGWRSAEFTGVLVQAGLEAYNLEGGVCAWAAAGQPLVDADGQASTRIHAFSDGFVGCVPAGFEAVTP